jgi:hypothetical protein
MKIDWKKITSRKFILALIGNITGIATALSNSDNVACVIVGISLSVLCSVAYMIIEGTIDLKRIKQDFKMLENALDEVFKEDENDRQK